MSFLTSWKELVNTRWRSSPLLPSKLPSTSTLPSKSYSIASRARQHLPWTAPRSNKTSNLAIWNWRPKFGSLCAERRQQPSKICLRPYSTTGASVPPELAHKLREESMKSTNKAAPIFIPGTASGLIILTSQERRLVDFMKEAVEKSQCGAELRIAGGWVRDKLLGLASGDVDIAVDCVSGEALSQILQDYISTLEPKERNEIYGIVESSSDGSQDGLEVVPSEKPSFAVTKLNPLQSKHLETAIMKMFGLELNFAQLRTDVYDSQSRIPQIKTARPLEDAFRRDFTINSLFYNIMTDSIEDFTGKGITSLLEHSINTPLPPLETLQDDPLRALRAIRFAARFGFSIHSELRASIEDPSVHRLLASKVTPPRIGVEVQKMLSPVVLGPPPSTTGSLTQPFEPTIGTLEIYHENNPLQALDLLVSTNLHRIVFDVNAWLHGTSTRNWTDQDTKRSLMLCNYLYHIFQVIDRHRAEVEQMVKPIQLSVLLAMTFLYPLLGSSYPTLLADSKKSSVPWLNTFKSTLQYPLSEVFRISQALGDSAILQREIDDISSHLTGHRVSDYVEAFTIALEQDEGRRTRIGIWLRNAPTFWRTLLLWSRLTRPNTQIHAFPTDLTSNWISQEFYREMAMLEAIEKTQLTMARTLIPHFNGNEVQDLLGIPRGPLVGQALNKQLEFQVAFIHCTKQEAKTVLETFKKEQGW